MKNTLILVLYWMVAVVFFSTVVILSTKQVLDTLDGYPSCFPPFTYVPASESLCPRAPTVSEYGYDGGLRIHAGRLFQQQQDGD